ncbi:unnamed protein product, partial [Protopolystoma xenopodis]
MSSLQTGLEATVQAPSTSLPSALVAMGTGVKPRSSPSLQAAPVPRPADSQSAPNNPASYARQPGSAPNGEEYSSRTPSAAHTGQPNSLTEVNRTTTSSQQLICPPALSLFSPPLTYSVPLMGGSNNSTGSDVWRR